MILTQKKKKAPKGLLNCFLNEFLEARTRVELV